MNRLPPTRQSLLIRLREKGGDAWPEFLEIYQQAIYGFARRRGLQDADAWDVTQEVLAAVEKKLDSWQDDPAKGTFRGWLFRVARNMAADKVIEQSRRAAASGDTQVAQQLAELPDSPEQQSSIFWVEYRRTLMNWAVERIQGDFQESSWQAFLATAIEGQRPDEVAQRLGISVGSVYAAKFRIIARIRKLVEQYDDNPQAGDELFQSLERNDTRTL